MYNQEHVRGLLAGLSLTRENTSSSEYDPFFHHQEPTFHSQHKNLIAPNFLPFHYPQIPSFSNGSDSFSLNNSRNVSFFDRRPRWSFPLERFRGKLVEFAKNQYGCKLLQKVLGNGVPEEIEIVFSEIIEHVGELMVDQFGNYVVQKIVEVCTDEQRSQIVMAITKFRFELVTICLNMHGTRAVQILLRYINSSQNRSMIMAALRPGFVVLIKDVNGHHVIVHCLKNFSFEENEKLRGRWRERQAYMVGPFSSEGPSQVLYYLDLLNEAAKYCSHIARDKSGCCVLQLCVEKSHGETRDQLVDRIISNAFTLSEDPYGNYVVQHLLGSKIPEITACILNRLRGEFAALSQNKYGSNVVEKCLSVSTEEQSSQIIIEILHNPIASMILVDQYGNFVIQSALMVAKGEVYGALVGLIQMNLQMMRNNMYGKKVLAWFERRRIPLVRNVHFSKDLHL